MVKIIATGIILVLTCFISEQFVLVLCHLRKIDTNRPALISYRQSMLVDYKNTAGSDQYREWENTLEIHPFFGYTYDPKMEGVNNFGFKTKYDISLLNNKYSLANKGGGKTLTVGIFGGSFAEVIGHESSFLEKRLARLFPGRTPVVINFAIAGHALPQSAFIFIYFRRLIDVAVFVDGLNEIWNPLENNKADYPPEYAKAVHFNYILSLDRLTPETFYRTAAILRARESIKLATEFSLAPIVKESLVVHYTWVLWVRLMQRIIYSNYLAIEKSYQTQGNFFDISDDRIQDFAVQQWKDYHCLINNIAHSENILNISLLQPNPYVPGSKQLTNSEFQLVHNSYNIQKYVVPGYPKLEQAEADLKGSGLLVEDLTYIFKDVKTPIWEDSSHPNKAGSRIILNRIAELIGKNYK